MNVKKSLLSQGVKLMSDPRIVKVVQSEQFMKAMMVALSMPAKIDEFAKKQAEQLAKKLALATSDDVRDLKRTVRALEEEVAELRNRHPEK